MRCGGKLWSWSSAGVWVPGSVWWSGSRVSQKLAELSRIEAAETYLLLSSEIDSLHYHSTHQLLLMCYVTSPVSNMEVSPTAKEKAFSSPQTLNASINKKTKLGLGPQLMFTWCCTNPPVKGLVWWLWFVQSGSLWPEQCTKSVTQ